MSSRALRAVAALALVVTAALQGLAGAGSARALERQPSPLLATLTIEKTGSGATAGHIVGPGGIDCGTVCSSAFPVGTTVDLLNVISSGRLTSWGGCDTFIGTSYCTVTLDESRTVEVHYLALRSLTISVLGAGTVTSATGDACAATTCKQVYTDGDAVALTAQAAAGWRFVGWGATCSGSQSFCAFLISDDSTVTALFEEVPAPVPAPEPAPPAPVPAPPAPTPAASTCTITGTPGADVLTGTPGRDILCGLGGDDRLAGLGGNDVLLGGAGKDVLTGGAGSDRLEGGRGADRIAGGAGADVLLARDRVQDRLDGGLGRDRARVDRGRDVRKRIESLI